VFDDRSKCSAVRDFAELVNALHHPEGNGRTGEPLLQLLALEGIRRVSRLRCPQRSGEGVDAWLERIWRKTSPQVNLPLVPPRANKNKMLCAFSRGHRYDVLLTVQRSLCNPQPATCTPPAKDDGAEDDDAEHGKKTVEATSFVVAKRLRALVSIYDAAFADPTASFEREIEVST
jgi:hypothetical protein